MPKPVQRVSEGRPKRAVFAAGIRQFPKRLVIITEGDSWFSYPLNAKLAKLTTVLDDLVAALGVDEAHARLRALAGARPGFRIIDMRAALAENCWRPVLEAQFPGRGFD